MRYGTTVAFLTGLLLTTLSCSKKTDVNQVNETNIGLSCSESSECEESICVHGVCRESCDTDADCGANGVCLPGDGGGGCRLADEKGCDSDPDCPGDLVCAIDDSCRAPCPCPSGYQCIEDACFGVDDSELKCSDECLRMTLVCGGKTELCPQICDRAESDCSSEWESFADCEGDPPDEYGCESSVPTSQDCGSELSAFVACAGDSGTNGPACPLGTWVSSYKGPGTCDAGAGTVTFTVSRGDGGGLAFTQSQRNIQSGPGCSYDFAGSATYADDKLMAEFTTEKCEDGTVKTGRFEFDVDADCTMMTGDGTFTVSNCGECVPATGACVGEECLGCGTETCSATCGDSGSLIRQ